MTRARTLLALAAVFALTGCASATAPATGPGADPAASQVAASTPKAQAAAEAKRILATFRPPAGATRISARPAGASLLAKPADTPETPNLLDQVEWWRTTGDPQTVATSIEAPAGSVGRGQSSSGGPTGSTYGVEFDWPADAVLDARQLQVSTVADGSQTIIRVDAVVTWLPVRPADSIVPATAKVVTVTYTPGLSRGTKVGPITSSDPAVVAQVVAAVNDQPMRPLGTYNCPMSQGRAMTVVFAAQPGGPALAKAVIAADGCTPIDVSVTGGGSATLTGGTAVVTKIAGLMHIKVPDISR
jgi:hypothetical protein